MQFKPSTCNLAITSSLIYVHLIQLYFSFQSLLDLAVFVVLCFDSFDCGSFWKIILPWHQPTQSIATFYLKKWIQLYMVETLLNCPEHNKPAVNARNNVCLQFWTWLFFFFCKFVTICTQFVKKCKKINIRVSSEVSICTDSYIKMN